MTFLCETVQSLGKQMRETQNLHKQMQDGFAFASCRRQEDYKKMEAAMTAKMEEAFRNMAQIGLQAIKKKNRQLESGSGSGSTVGSDLSTAVERGPSGFFARPRKEWPSGSTT